MWLLLTFWRVYYISTSHGSQDEILLWLSKNLLYVVVWYTGDWSLRCQIEMILVTLGLIDLMASENVCGEQLLNICDKWQALTYSIPCQMTLPPS